MPARTGIDPNAKLLVQKVADNTTQTAPAAAADYNDVAANIGDIAFNTGQELFTARNLNSDTRSRLQGIQDMTITITGDVADQTGETLEVFRDFEGTPGHSRWFLISLSGITLGVKMMQSSFNISRSQSGELSFTSELSLAAGIKPNWSQVIP